MKQTLHNTKLVLHQLEYMVLLGCGEPERKTPQRVTMDIIVYFVKPSAACKTDALVDTFCYDTLQQSIRTKLANQEFLLIEHLAYTVYTWVKDYLSFENALSIGITKYPDAFFKSAGVSFWYGDDEVPA